MKKSFSFFFLVILLAGAPGLHAAIEKELGQALAYLRVTDADADSALVVDTISRRPALVLDLRSVSTANRLTETVHSALAKPPAPHAVRIILINATTTPALVATLADALPSVVTIGPRSPALTPDIAVTISAEEDLRAFDALTNGTPLEKLISDSQDKPRYDEAKLVQDHANGVTPPEAMLPADADDDSVAGDAEPKKKPADAEKKPAPLIDLVLERAVQLHRSLLALKKL